MVLFVIVVVAVVTGPGALVSCSHLQHSNKTEKIMLPLSNGCNL